MHTMAQHSLKILVLCITDQLVVKSRFNAAMTEQIDLLQTRIAPLKQAIVNHKVYNAITNIEDVKHFMEHHIYAVWDFMSLLKSLQMALTCTQVPWLPKGSADTRYLINEIVLGEEADVDLNGQRRSHFELYLDAMQQCGANQQAINTFIHTLRTTGSLQDAMNLPHIPPSARQFMSYTFDVVHSGKPHVQSAVFTFGREDLIPDMFLSIIQELHAKFPDEIAVFKYYIERHIEVDGGHHSDLALQMTAHLCGDNPAYWQEAEEAVVKSLQQRIALWDGVYDAIMASKQ